MSEIYATSDDCSDCEAVIYDIGRYELRLCSLHAAAPKLLEALKAECAYWGQPPVDKYSYDSVREDNWERSQAAMALATEDE